ncbi:MAG: hypothetical protein RJQ14_13785 [Marinoscillum sp.]
MYISHLCPFWSHAANGHVTWRSAQYHRPMRPHTAGKAEQNDQYNSWAGRFNNHNVKLVVECDAHTVKTTWPVVPSTGSGNDEGFIRDDANGTVFVGEGCWGAPLRTNNDDKSWTRNSGVFNQFKLIFVDQDKIEVRTIKLDNATSVGENSNGNPFAFPSNLDIWSPSNGSVVTIQNSNNGNPNDYLDDCDALTGWSSAGGNSLTLSGTVKQGNNSVKMIGSGTNEFQKVFSPSYNSGLTPSNARLEFWYYVSDPSRMNTTNNQVELGSGGAPDVNEYHWTLSSFTAGWNFVSLDVSAAGTTGGTPDLNAINWFRIYNSKSGSVTNRIDAIELVQTGIEYLTIVMP